MLRLTSRTTTTPRKRSRLVLGWLEQRNCPAAILAFDGGALLVTGDAAAAVVPISTVDDDLMGNVDGTTAINAVATDNSRFRAAFGSDGPSEFDLDNDGDVDTADYAMFRTQSVGESVDSAVMPALNAGAPSAASADIDVNVENSVDINVDGEVVDAANDATFRAAFGSDGPSEFDLDNDGDVDTADYAMFRTQTGGQGTPDYSRFRAAYGSVGPSEFDLDNDGDVGTADFSMFRSEFGATA